MSQMEVHRETFVFPEARDLVASLVAESQHPVSAAVSKHLVPGHNSEKTNDIMLQNVTQVLGKGIQATYRGYMLRGGSKSFALGSDIALVPQDSAEDDMSRFYVGLGKQLVAYFSLQDPPRPESAQLVERLRAMRKEVFIISGDLPAPTRKLATQVGIPVENVYASCSPEAKVEAVQMLQRRFGAVCYVGDGSNDAPALSIADVSFVVSQATTVAEAAAGVVLTSPDLLAGISNALTLAKIGRWHIKAGLGWSVLYNILALLLAAGAFVNVRVPPQWAGLGELVSVLPVIVIALATTWSWPLLRRSSRNNGIQRFYSPVVSTGRCA
jgi:Cd2+-exporting ATPase